MSGRTIGELRAYSRGMQPPKKYQDILDPVSPNVREGRSLMGITWDNYRSLTKILDIAVERIMMIPFDTGTLGVDEVLVGKRNKAAGLMKAKVSPLGKMSPVPLDNGGLTSTADVDDFVAMGLLALEEEMKIKDTADATAEMSGADAIDSMLITDLAQLGICAKRVCERGGNVYYEYVDPEKLVFPQSIYPDLRDMWYVGMWENINISQLREQSGYGEDTLREIATSVTKGTVNVNIGGLEAFGQRQRYDDIKVKVFRMWWKASDAEDFMIGVHKKTGGRIFSPAPKNYEPRPYADTELETRKEQFVYEASWVVGTEHIFGQMKTPRVVKYGGQPQLPVIVYQMQNPAITERCIPVVDAIQLEMHSISNMLAKLPPAPRYLIDESLLAMATDVSGRNEMTNNIQEFFRTGALRHRSANEYGDQGPSNRPPITSIDLNIANELQTRMMRIETLKNELRELSGINEAADGTIKQQDMLVGVMESMEAAATMVLAPYVRARKDVLARSTKFAIKKWQMLARNKKVTIPSYRNGQSKKVEYGPEMSDHEFDIQVIALPTRQDQDFLIQNLVNNKNTGAITEADFMLIYGMIRAGDIKKAQFYTAKAVQRNKREEAERQERMIQMQGQMTAQAGVATEQEKQKGLGEQAQLKQTEKMAEGKLQAFLEDLKHQNKMKEIALEQSLKASAGNDLQNR